MKASYRWIRALVPALAASPKELAARFTQAGLEVEGSHEYGEGTEACLVVAVVSTRPHPTKSGLNLVTVDRGGPGRRSRSSAARRTSPLRAGSSSWRRSGRTSLRRG